MLNVSRLYFVIAPVLLAGYLMLLTRTRLFYLEHPERLALQLSVYAAILLCCIVNKKFWGRIIIASGAVVISDLVVDLAVNISSGHRYFLMDQGLVMFLELLFYLWLVNGGLFVLISMIILEKYIFHYPKISRR
jgi:hypothetical protein